ncbi:U3 small nucleolar RNA-associated protein 18 homolog [Hypanus sabinus]|uniref:U3 small nucleolar RNA-associated protein 18 homolog n=1 Tax=Hypanus sabinus TaxID=79690 RepID=UPI0028C4353D|nr:U3 small nucleolar RNA-associated protein 18 homolog [Hypanus sabinus]
MVADDWQTGVTDLEKGREILSDDRLIENDGNSRSFLEMRTKNVTRKAAKSEKKMMAWMGKGISEDGSYFPITVFHPTQRKDRDQTLLDESSSDSEVENEARSDLPPHKRAAWVDEEDGADDDVEMTHRFRKNLVKSSTEKTLTMRKLQQRLKEQFQTAMGGTPSWAERKVKNKRKDKEDSAEESDDDDDDLLRKTGNFVSASSVLPKGILQIKKCTDANHARPSTCNLTTTQFHPLAQVILTAGNDQAISLFQVDGKTNPKIQSVCLQRFPVFKARFSADGEQVIATTKHGKMFYKYDMMAGAVIPLNVRGMQDWQARRFEVSPDGQFLLFLGSSGYLHLLSSKVSERGLGVVLCGSL